MVRPGGACTWWAAGTALTEKIQNTTHPEHLGAGCDAEIHHGGELCEQRRKRAN